MKKRKKSEERHAPPSDSFDAWLVVVGTLVFEPVIDMFRSVGKLIRGSRPSAGRRTGQRRRRRSRGPRHRRGKP